ncbi:AAA domain-containing protein [Paenibacillus sp. FJAT-26967]|uniref:AAA domain-containing protein n=1 Tax=Paenibacillus sp. FJAT-26967 TaxID=1729690 RepID=UPI00083940F8|nr:AAA domain-containing protein [Paenibacillus sp. FJAT-26967]
MQEILKLYRDRLTDLTANNKSLKLMRLTNKNHFDIHSFANIEKGLETCVMEGVCAQKDEIILIPQSSLEEEAVLANRKLIQLKREIDLIEQETGNNPFYVGYGFLEGYLVPNFFIRCPILFYPVRLSRKNVNNKPFWMLEVGEEASPFINRTFIMAIHKYVGGDISLSIQEELSSLPANLPEILPYIYELLRKHDISLTLETSQVIMPFKNMKKENIPEGKKGFTLYPYALMGKFQQSASTLLNDYNSLLENMPETGFLNELFNGSENSEGDFDEISLEELNKVHPSENFFVLDTDASQEAVVIASRNKKGLIVHGPPGTGKSQVIVNLIVDRMSKGQKVLLVCQKPAALDVVYNRLGQINLQSHVALVHDFNKNKVDVYGKIASVIDRALPKTGQDYSRISNEKHVLAEKLNQIASALHKERPFGKSLFNLYSMAKLDQAQIIEVEDLLNNLTYNDLESHLVDLKTIIELKKKYDNRNYPWSKRKSFAAFTVKQHLELNSILEPMVMDIKKAVEVKRETSVLFEPVYYLENMPVLQELEKAIVALKERGLYKHITKFFNDEKRESDNEVYLEMVRQNYGILLKKINILNHRPEPITNLSYEEATKWNEKITKFDEFNKKLTRFLNSNWYSLKKEVQEHCKANGISFDGHSVREYQEKIESFLLFEKLRLDTLDVPFFSDSTMENKIEQWNTWLKLKEKSIQFLHAFVQAQVAFPQLLRNPESNSVLEDYHSEAGVKQVQGLIKLAELTKELHIKLSSLRLYLIDEQVNDLKQQINAGIYNPSDYEGLHKTLNQFDSLCRLDQMKEELGSFKNVLLERCAKKSSLEDTPDVVTYWIDVIRNSFLHAWILQIESTDPQVKDVSTEIYDRNLARFRDLLKEKRKTVPSLIDSVLANTSAQVVGSTRQKLKHESNKKRKLIPLRQVVGHFYEDLLKLIPCWLCTPEAVSAIFPMNQDMFDLVIFDEASQCPVENAVPSIYRAKQLIIAGDEKQLPPSSFFQASSDDEDEEEEDNAAYVDNTDKHAKSLLEWAKPKFPDKWLTWHYRSEYEELINFSNYAFYDKRVQIAPSVAKGGDSKPIEFIKVDGQWENRSNRIEAERIVDTVIDVLQNDTRKPTLGIITFNKQQADLINDVFEARMAANTDNKMLIEEAKSRKNGEENVGLFIKNIENVQGDERDVILFSVGYAKDMSGKMVSQFGPLSRDGGENRLNVAISRAKKKVYIVCSFEPSEWTRVETYARGVKLFKRYLEYGKAISDNNYELAQSMLNGLVDATNVQDLHNQLIFDSGFEEEVCHALRARGYEVHTQVGFSGYRIDLAIVDPVSKEKYILGIECDGAAFHSSKVARERDLYRQRFLESKGWRIHRIWSRNWWLAGNKEIEKIISLIKEIA